jgi:hypothetical protein
LDNPYLEDFPEPRNLRRRCPHASPPFRTSILTGANERFLQRHFLELRHLPVQAGLPVNPEVVLHQSDLHDLK